MHFKYICLNFFFFHIYFGAIRKCFGGGGAGGGAGGAAPGLFARIRGFFFGSVHLQNAVTEATMSEIQTTLARLEKKVNTSLRTSISLTFRNYNAYENMTQTSAGKNKDRQSLLRTNFYERYQITDAKNTAKTQATCVLTGRSGTLKLAHLVPVSSSKDVRAALKLTDEDIWSFRNVLLLSWQIEHFFDRCKLSFMANPLHSGVYTMKIWCDTVRDKLIWAGAKETIKGSNNNKIGFYDGHELKLHMPNGEQLEPFKRCLSYQAFICFVTSKLPIMDSPEDFSSDIGTEWPRLRNDLLVLRNSLDKQIYDETADSETEDFCSDSS